MKHIVTKLRTHFTQRDFVISCLISVLLITVSLVVNYYAAGYALSHESNPVTDIVLSNIRTYNVDGIFIYGPIVFWAIIAWFCLKEPKRIPLVLKSVAVLVLVRSAFITLTHIGPSPDRVIIDAFDWNFIKLFTTSTNFFLFSSGGDLFFSNHTALPFLMALVFWNHLNIRIFCIISSIFFGIIVLMGHLHYSIDVASAFFITYTVYVIICKIFPKDKEIFASL